MSEDLKNNSNILSNYFYARPLFFIITCIHDQGNQILSRSDYLGHKMLVYYRSLQNHCSAYIFEQILL